MKPHDYPAPLAELIGMLKRLPSIGARGAERLALWLLQQGRNEALALSLSLQNSVEQVEHCSCCGFFTLREQLCTICQSVQREATQLCIVEQATDVLPIERAGIYRGYFHCLGGKISPLDGVMPEDLSIGKLHQRIEQQGYGEIILALGSDVEGEATALYLAEELKKQHPAASITRLAQGMPAGSGLGHADSVTLMRAFEGRQSYE